MAVIVPCPKCGTRLSAPDDAAGKQLRCPKPGCGALAQAPLYVAAEEVAVVEAVAVTPMRPRAIEEDEDEPPKKKPRRDEDDEDFDRPRRKQRRQSAGPSPGVIFAISLGCVLLLGGTGIGVYLLVSKKKDSPAATSDQENNDVGGNRPKAAIPAGWVPYTSPSKSFSAYFPKHPTSSNASTGGNEVEMAILGGPKERLAAIVVALKLPPEAAGINRDRIAESMRQGVMKKQGRMRLVSQRSIAWLGRTALEMTFEQDNNMKGTLLVRQLTTEKYMYFAFFGDSTGHPSPDEENGFFDNFELPR